MTSFRRLLVPILIAASAPFCLWANVYQEPKLDEVLFNSSSVQAPTNTTKVTSDMLLSLTRIEEVDPVTKAKAIALAYSFYPENRELIIVRNFALKHKLPEPGSEEVEEFTLTQVEGHLGELIDMIQKGSGVANVVATDLLRDVRTSISDPMMNQSDKMKIWATALPWALGVDPNAPSVELASSEATLTGLYFMRNKWDSSTGTKYYVTKKVVAREVETSSGSGAGSNPLELEIEFGNRNDPMTSAIKEINKYFLLHSIRVPSDAKFVLDSGDMEYLEEEGPTGALMCALMLEAMVKGHALDPNFAPIGDFHGDGTVKPIYDIEPRLAVASSSFELSHIALPSANVQDLADTLLLKGVNPLLDVQIFSVSNFEEAKALALAPDDRAPEINEAIQKFAEIEQAIKGARANDLITNPQVQERLQEVVDLAPNHASAKLLLLRSANRNPQRLSVSRSLTIIEDYKDDQRSLIEKRDLLHEKTQPLAHALINYPDRADQEWENLMNDPEAREILMRE